MRCTPNMLTRPLIDPSSDRPTQTPKNMAVAVASAPQRRFGRMSSIIHFINSGPESPSALDESRKKRLAA